MIRFVGWYEPVHNSPSCKSIHGESIAFRSEFAILIIIQLFTSIGRSPMVDDRTNRRFYQRWPRIPTLSILNDYSQIVDNFHLNLGLGCFLAVEEFVGHRQRTWIAEDCSRFVGIEFYKFLDTFQDSLRFFLILFQSVSPLQTLSIFVLEKEGKNETEKWLLEIL